MRDHETAVIARGFSPAAIQSNGCGPWIATAAKGRLAMTLRGARLAMTPMRGTALS